MSPVAKHAIDDTCIPCTTVHLKVTCVLITSVYILPLNLVTRNTSNQRSCNLNCQWPSMKAVCLIKLFEGPYVITLFHVT